MKLWEQHVPFTPLLVSYETQDGGWQMGEGPREADLLVVSRVATFDGRNLTLRGTKSVLWDVRADHLVRAQMPHAKLTVKALCVWFHKKGPNNLSLSLVIAHLFHFLFPPLYPTSSPSFPFHTLTTNDKTIETR